MVSKVPKSFSTYHKFPNLILTLCPSCLRPRPPSESESEPKFKQRRYIPQCGLGWTPQPQWQSPEEFPKLMIYALEFEYDPGRNAGYSCKAIEIRMGDPSIENLAGWKLYLGTLSCFIWGQNAWTTVKGVNVKSRRSISSAALRDMQTPRIERYITDPTNIFITYMGIEVLIGSTQRLCQYCKAVNLIILASKTLPNSLCTC